MPEKHPSRVPSVMTALGFGGIGLTTATALSDIRKTVPKIEEKLAVIVAHLRKRDEEAEAPAVSESHAALAQTNQRKGPFHRILGYPLRG